MKIIIILFLFQTIMFANKEDIHLLFEEYFLAFKNKDYKSISNCFDFPTSFILQHKTINASSRLKLKLIYRKIIGDLPVYYSYSRIDNLSIKIVDDNLALVDAQYSRFKKDGSSYYTGTGIYGLRKSDGGWKIYSMMPYNKIDKIN